MTKKEIMQELDKLQVDYNEKATKAELQKLLDDKEPQEKEEAAEESDEQDESGDQGTRQSRAPVEGEDQERTEEVVDVVYPLSIESGWNDNEIKHSIRSLYEHFENLGKIYIIGHLPDFLSHDGQDLIHIPFPDSYTENKDANLINKLLRACQEEGLTDRFLFISDDQYLVEDVSVDEMVPFYSVPLENRGYDMGNKWERRLQRTYKALKARGKVGYEYDTHAPVIIEKDKFVEVMLSYDYGVTPGYCINSLYFSHTREEHVQRDGEVIRVLNATESREAILERMKGAKYLNHNDNALKGAVTEVIEELFPSPSPLEYTT